MYNYTLKLVDSKILTMDIASFELVVLCFVIVQTREKTLKLTFTEFSMLNTV